MSSLAYLYCAIDSRYLLYNSDLSVPYELSLDEPPVVVVSPSTADAAGSAKIDIIIWGLPGMPDAKNPLWSKVQAVQQKKIVTHALDDPVTRPGPRFAPALINMRKKIEKSAGK